MSLYLEINARLLPFLRKNECTLTTTLLRSSLRSIKECLIASYCVHAFVAYERYLQIFSIRLNDRSIHDEFTLVGWAFFEQEFQKDPSRFDILVGLAYAKIRGGEIDRGRHLLRRVAASGYRERDLARQILDGLI